MSRRPGLQPSSPSSRARWGLNKPTEEPIEWRERPPAAARLMSAVSAPVAAAVLVFVAIGLIFAVTVWSRPHEVGDETEQASELLMSSSVAAQEGLASSDRSHVSDAQPADARHSASESHAKQRIIVHVVGEVSRPGIIELNDGARVADALEQAGGATEDAVLSAINLARVLADGEQVLVPNASQAELMTSAAGPDAAGGFSTGLVNLNRADASTLETLPRVGPALAQRIIEWRESNGGFVSTEQLLNVSGIGHKTYEQLQPLVTV